MSAVNWKEEDSAMKEALSGFIKQKIVVDTRSPFLYIGTLEEIMNGCIVLSDVDVHDSTDSVTPKERYVIESKTTGVKVNRHGVFISMDWIISFSLLDDVKDFREF